MKIPRTQWEEETVTHVKSFKLSVFFHLGNQFWKLMASKFQFRLKSIHLHACICLNLKSGSLAPVVLSSSRCAKLPTEPFWTLDTKHPLCSLQATRLPGHSDYKLESSWKTQSTNSRYGGCCSQSHKQTLLLLLSRGCQPGLISRHHQGPVAVSRDTFCLSHWGWGENVLDVQQVEAGNANCQQGNS